MFKSNDAHAILADQLDFAGVNRQTEYISVFLNKRGKALALERNRSSGYFVWVEDYKDGFEGIVVKNSKNPGMPYSREQSRNSNLNDRICSSLKRGNKVWYLKIDSLASLKDFSKWYASL